jgi:hypothetical protein
LVQTRAYLLKSGFHTQPKPVEVPQRQPCNLLFIHHAAVRVVPATLLFARLRMSFYVVLHPELRSPFDTGLDFGATVKISARRELWAPFAGD